MGRILRQKVKLIQEANRRLDEQMEDVPMITPDRPTTTTPAVTAAVISNEPDIDEGPCWDVYNDFIKKLEDTLKEWEDGDYQGSDEFRWKSYANDIKNLKVEIEKASVEHLKGI